MNALKKKILTILFSIYLIIELVFMILTSIPKFSKTCKLSLNFLNLTNYIFCICSCTFYFFFRKFLKKSSLLVIYLIFSISGFVIMISLFCVIIILIPTNCLTIFNEIIFWIFPFKFYLMLFVFSIYRLKKTIQEYRDQDVQRFQISQRNQERLLREQETGVDFIDNGLLHPNPSQNQPIIIDETPIRDQSENETRTRKTSSLINRLKK